LSCCMSVCHSIHENTDLMTVRLVVYVSMNGCLFSCMLET